MKRAFIIFISGLLLAATAYCGFYFLGSAAERNLAQSQTPELAWLKKEFHLDDAEFQRISELHAAYQTHCAEMCGPDCGQERRVAGAARQPTTRSPRKSKSKLSEAAQIRADCQAAMLAHFCEVSRTMPPAEGKRYLAWVAEKTSAPCKTCLTRPAQSAHDPGHH